MSRRETFKRISVEVPNTIYAKLLPALAKRANRLYDQTGKEHSAAFAPWLREKMREAIKAEKP